ncbi:HD domain-containing phosphohydrolase [Anaerocolumna xylanovorans]|uniref:Stage 0 sporulation protein A homolog n=1 Tax=Anaerocolumna xylanovorans DSM 12503 TaxID=1121345 RepID=A0A1M7Y3F6_9FIRM|nr:HD domain-containing phosphohydrolase [Anaerocolumna xylanovorans]SHO46717.1 Response regulator receiver domain-containing protein [Anaerocolumna xylanovorans DSM 12503]
MIKDWSNIELDYDFLKDEEENRKKTYGSYKILISDDEPEVHNVTKMILKDFIFENHTLEFLDAYNEEETIRAFEQYSDIAVLFQDVVMEKNNTGLDIINRLRCEMKNQTTRIILRTGQPGEAPEEKIIRDYDINDYCLKTDLTVARLKTTIITALRSYRDIIRLDKYRKGLEKIIETSANLFTHNTLSDFLTSILNHLSGFYYETEGIMYIREKADSQKNNGFVTMEQSNIPVVVAATGSYVQYIGKDVRAVDELASIYQWMSDGGEKDSQVTFIGEGFIIRNNTIGELNNYIFIEGDKERYDFDLIKLFLANYSVALDNYLLNNMIFNSQKEIILSLGGIAEKHFDETGEHVDRVSKMMYNFSKIMGYSPADCEKIKLASILHDIGKIGLPDDILKKPGKLTEKEFEIIKEHTKIGHEMLSKSKLEILHMASEIALCHHERYDGTGYPRGLKRDEIPQISRMIAIIDVYDAMCHKRVYKEASTHEEAMEYIASQKDKHFDRRLVDVFFNNYQDIIV